MRQGLREMVGGKDQVEDCGVDEQQVAISAPDEPISLIFIEVTRGSTNALSGAVKRIHSHINVAHSMLLREGCCALLLPTTPFSGAQALANRLGQFLVNLRHEIHVYHGTTAYLIVQRLQASGAITIKDAQNTIHRASVELSTTLEQNEIKEISPRSIPHLAFLTQYPAPALLHLFPYELACRYQCAPIGATRNMLTLATCHWLNREIIKHIRTTTRRGIFQVHCEVTIIDDILRHWQRLQDISNKSASLHQDVTPTTLRLLDVDLDSSELDEQSFIPPSPVQQLI